MADNDFANRVPPHTPAPSEQSGGRSWLPRRLDREHRSLTRWRWPTLVVACAAAFALGPGSVRAEEWRETGARVIWTREPFVYVAADSGVLVPGMPLEFRRGKRHLGSASVERLLEPGLALARLSDGSLAREKRLDKLRVRAGAAPEWPHAALRVGLPAPARTHLLFACGTPRWNSTHGGYTADTLARGLVALRRVPGMAASLAEPETLVVRFFADASDQEIALERGELDVAVFWPGELSARMRADPRWRGPVLARRQVGVLACAGGSPDSLAPDPEALAAIQRDVFADDLEPLGLAPRAGATPVRLARIEPDPSLPGAAALATVLARVGPRGPALRLVYVASDAGTGAGGSLQPVFALRCAVLVAPSWRDGWPAHTGAAELANLLQCGGSR